jgi:hypothetical protein
MCNARIMRRASVGDKSKQGFFYSLNDLRQRRAAEMLAKHDPASRASVARRSETLAWTIYLLAFTRLLI